MTATTTTVETNETEETKKEYELPASMTAAQGKDYGDIDEMLSVKDGIPLPALSDIENQKQRDHFLLIRTLAVSLAPGDCRVLSGKTRELQGPPRFPYIPGGDVCGVVVKPSLSSPQFQVGDVVAACFYEKPHSALAEYSYVHDRVCDIVPANVSPEGASTIGSSGTTAISVAEYICQGDRVLILGAGGGVGSFVCQHARLRGASYVVGVSRDPERLLSQPLSCDRAVDYTKQDVWSLEEFQKEPFDLIIDLASGGWPRILQDSSNSSPLIVKTAKEGGRYMTLSPDKPIFEAHSMWKVLQIFLFPALHRAFYTRTTHRQRLPKYSYLLGLPSERKPMTKALQLASEGKVIPCVDPEGPFDLSTEGVRRAFRLQESRHIRGKVVIKVADK